MLHTLMEIYSIGNRKKYFRETPYNVEGFFLVIKDFIQK